MNRYLIILFFIFLASCNHKTSLSGLVKVLDGDSLLLNETSEIRLWGIDAPEYKQNCYHNNQKIQCGKKAKKYLQSQTKGQKIRCQQKDIDRYNRIVALCFNAQGIELNKIMVQNGWAIDYTYYSGGRYRLLEYQAKQKQLGLWQYRFELPSLWRKKNRS